MPCLELALEEINANCQSAVKGFEKIGWMIPWSYIDHVAKTFVGSQAVFELLGDKVAYPIYERSLNPFKGTKTEGKNEAAGYYPNWTETVVFPLLTNDPANADLVKAMSNEEERFVFILEQIDKGIEDNARYPVFGLRNGLTLKGSVNDASTGIAWLATFEGLNLPDAALFLGAPNDTAEAISLKFDAIPKAV